MSPKVKTFWVMINFRAFRVASMGMSAQSAALSLRRAAIRLKALPCGMLVPAHDHSIRSEQACSERWDIWLRDFLLQIEGTCQAGGLFLCHCFQLGVQENTERMEVAVGR